MQWQLSPSVMAESGTALGILIVAVCFPWRDVSRRARLIGSALLIIAALWIFTHSLEIGIPVASYKASLMGMQLIWGLLALTLWLIYIIHYTATEKWQTRRIYILFGIMPLLAILALVTNNIYGLMWTDPGLNINNPYLPLEPAYGLVYWIFMAYMGALIVAGSYLVIRKVLGQHNFRGWEPWILILAVVMPLIVAFLEVAGFTKDLTIGLTPFFSGIGSILLVWTLPRFHLQNIIPIARETVFEHIGDGVVVLNMQNRVVDLNPAAEHLAGYTNSQALGLPVEQIWTNWPSQLEQASTVFLGLTLAHDGEQRTYSLHPHTITDHKNRPLNKVVLLMDITERKRGEEALKASEEQLKGAQALGRIGSWEFDIEKREITWSEETYILYERDPKLGPPSLEEEARYYSPEQAKVLRGYTARAIATGQTFSYDLEVKLPSGKKAYYHSVMKPVKGPEDKVVKLSGTTQDITERKQAGAELELRAQLLDAATDAIITLDTKGNVIYFNEAAHRSRGYTREEMTGKKLRDLVSPEFLQLISSQVDKMLKEKGEAIFEATDLYKDNSTIPVEVHSRMINLDGEDYIVNTSRDITERKRAETELKQSNASLDKAMQDTIQAMAVTCEMRDLYTAGHQQRVAQLVLTIAEELHLSDKEKIGLRTAAFLHDIGKMRVPSEILSKPGKLTTIEFDLIKMHVQASYDILKGINFPWPVAQIVYQHHERMDGSGYPNALSGKDIKFEARILAVADVIEAMASHRPYRSALGIDKALEEISRNKGILYDADVVDACLKVFRDKGFKFH